MSKLLYLKIISHQLIGHMEKLISIKRFEVYENEYVLPVVKCINQWTMAVPHLHS